MLSFMEHIFGVILMSFFIFPFEPSFLPNTNTKMILAAVGVLLLLYNGVKRKYGSLDKGFVAILCLGFVYSLFNWFAVVINNTGDYTYATYFISMLVWLSAGYTVIEYIRYVHGRLSVALVCNYMIAVGVFQCVSAMMIEYIPAMKSFVSSITKGVGFRYGFEDLQGERLYGIGAMLDVAGQRFSCILSIIAWLLIKSNDKHKIIIYLASFILIAVVGNMISRTTTVGVVIGIGIIIYSYLFSTTRNSEITVPMFTLFLLGYLVVTVAFHTSPSFNNYFRFGFEGFFNLFENGQWETHSNNILESMYRFPYALHTWLIGDGYFKNPGYDPYYIGYAWKGFYMGTDVGYLRFLYYSGLLGLILFSLYFIQIGRYCAQSLPKYKYMIWTLVAINFIGWLKVSSDIFMILVPFIILSCLHVPNKNQESLIDNQS